MIPGLWLNEGGQSAAGAALEQLVHLHRDAAEIEAEAAARGQSLIAHVAAHAETLGTDLSDTIRAAGTWWWCPSFWAIARPSPNRMREP